MWYSVLLVQIDIMSVFSMWDRLVLHIIQEGQFLAEEWAWVLVNCLRGLKKVWLGKLTVPDMTPMGWLGRKNPNLNISDKAIRALLGTEIPMLPTQLYPG